MKMPHLWKCLLLALCSLAHGKKHKDSAENLVHISAHGGLMRSDLQPDAKVNGKAEDPVFNPDPKLLADNHKMFTDIPQIGKHTSELQSHHDLVCRLLLEKKKT